MAKYKEFEPDWREETAGEGTFRSVYEWGEPDNFVTPTEKYYKFLKNELGLTDADFQERHGTGDKYIGRDDVPSALDNADADKFIEIVGDNYIALDTYSRLKAAYNGTAAEAAVLSRNEFLPMPDAVLYPASKEQIESIVDYAAKSGIRLVYGRYTGNGGVYIDLSRAYNRVVAFNEIDQTVTVEAGILGKELENVLNNAPLNFREYGIKRRYTLGYGFQGFDYTPAGYLLTEYTSGKTGDISSILVSAEYATKRGVVTTSPYGVNAAGGKLNAVMAGEGYGIPMRITFRIKRYVPANNFNICYMFRNYGDACNAMRDALQRDCGMPSVIRIADPDQTASIEARTGICNVVTDKYLELFKYRKGQRCMLIAHTGGTVGYAKYVFNLIKRSCRKYRGRSLTGYAVDAYDRNDAKFNYLRDSIADFGIRCDVMTVCTDWDRVPDLLDAIKHIEGNSTRAYSQINYADAHGCTSDIFLFTATDSEKLLAANYADIERAVIEKGAGIAYSPSGGRERAKDAAGTVNVKLLKHIDKFFG